MEGQQDMEWLLNKQFVWGTRYVDELILRDNDLSNPPDGTLDYRHYALQDANFNVVAIIGSTGSVVRRYSYDAYGHSTTLEADYTPGAYEYDFEYRYAGYRWDYETYLLHVRNRWYHPRLCRWLSRDPIGYDGGSWNLYEYVRGAPLVAVDPFGLRKETKKVKLKNGTFSVEFENDKNKRPYSIGVKVTFKANGDCPKCKLIKLVQIVRTYDPDGNDHVWEGAEANKEFLKTRNDIDKGIRGGFLVDHNATMCREGQPCSIFYRDHWENKKLSKDGHTGKKLTLGISVGASLFDAPQGTPGAIFEFETCAKCADGKNSDYFGCVEWGVKILGEQGGERYGDVSGDDSTSGTFDRAVRIFDAFYKNK
jgi:RHS repeat-associated protein